MEVGDEIQFRHGPIQTVLAVTAKTVVATYPNDDEVSYPIDVFTNTPEWSVNGERSYPAIDGWYTVDRSNQVFKATDLDQAWNAYNQDRRCLGVIGVTDHGGYGEWYWVDEHGVAELDHD